MRLHNLLLLLLFIPALAPAETDLIRKPSIHGVTETMDRLETLVTEKGMTVFARIDHRANAESVGKNLQDSQVLIFGDPKGGTRIMTHDLAVGLDLPLRVLVHADFDGNTWVIYHNPQGLKNNCGVEECKVLDKIEKALDMITDAITKAAPEKSGS